VFLFLFLCSLVHVLQTLVATDVLSVAHSNEQDGRQSLSVGAADSPDTVSAAFFFRVPSPPMHGGDLLVLCPALSHCAYPTSRPLGRQGVVAFAMGSACHRHHLQRCLHKSPRECHCHRRKPRLALSPRVVPTPTQNLGHTATTATPTITTTTTKTTTHPPASWQLWTKRAAPHRIPPSAAR
jgi:hypothetical protein